MPGLGGGRSAPVARGAFVLGSLASFWRDPLGTLVEDWRACGDIVRFRFLEGLLPDAYLLAHPDHVRHVLADEPAKYPKDPAQVAKLKAFAGNGLTFVDGELWQRERVRMEPGFAITHVEPLAGRIGEASATLAARWEAEVAPGEAIDVAVEMQRLGFELVARLLFDDGDDPAGAAIARASPILLAHAYQGIRFGIAAPG